MVELKGSLDGIGLSAIVQTIGELQHSGSLQLKSEQASAQLLFDSGHLVAAQCGDVHGPEAITACATQLNDAEFTFIEREQRTDRSLDLSPADLKGLLSACSNGASSNGKHAATSQVNLDEALVANEARRTEATAMLPLPPAGPAPPPPIPPGVASRLAAAGQMRIASPPARARRGPLLLVLGGIAGLSLVALILFVTLPLLSGQVGQQLGADAVGYEPFATATSLPSGADQTMAAPLTAPTAAPPLAAATLPPTPSALQLASAAAPPAPTLAAIANQLIAVRFAAAPVDNWLENGAYAGWSNGAYRMRAKDADRFVAVGVPVSQDFSDVIVSATFRKTGGPPGGGYGLIVRANGPGALDGVSQELDGYVLEAGDRGEFGVWRRDGDHWVDLVPWTQSSSVRSGGSPNDLSVKAIGSQLTFTVNDAVLATVDDDTIDTGRVGLFVGGDDNSVALDNFSIELP